MTTISGGVIRFTITTISQSVRIMVGISDATAATTHVPITATIRRITVPIVLIVAHRKFTNGGHS